jgi:hypothetical protein
MPRPTAWFQSESLQIALSAFCICFFTEPVITGRHAYKVQFFYEINHQHNDCGWQMIAEVAKPHLNLRFQKYTLCVILFGIQ